MISNVNIYEGSQLLCDRIKNALELSCSILTKTLSPKNIIKPWISGEICANINQKRPNYYSLVRQNKMPLQFYARFINFVKNQVSQQK